MRIEAHVLGEPKGQPRPRAYSRGGKAGVYDPGTANHWKMLVAAQMRDLLLSDPMPGPVSVSIKFVMPRPKRLQRSKDPAGEIPHITKPDPDNLAKAVLDVCSDLGVWRDDRQVCDLFVQKRYTRKDGRSGMHLVIESID